MYVIMHVYMYVCTDCMYHILKYVHVEFITIIMLSLIFITSIIIIAIFSQQPSPHPSLLHNEVFSDPTKESETDDEDDISIKSLVSNNMCMEKLSYHYVYMYNDYYMYVCLRESAICYVVGIPHETII